MPKVTPIFPPKVMNAIGDIAKTREELDRVRAEIEEAHAIFLGDIATKVGVDADTLTILGTLTGQPQILLGNISDQEWKPYADLIAAGLLTDASHCFSGAARGVSMTPAGNAVASIVSFDIHSPDGINDPI